MNDIIYWNSIYILKYIKNPWFSRVILFVIFLLLECFKINGGSLFDDPLDALARGKSMFVKTYLCRNNSFNI